MSILGDYFNHKDAIRLRVEQLESLNGVISERKEQVYEASEELRGLEARIKEIKTMFPGITEVEVWKKYTESLKQQNQILESDIASKRKELADLLAKLDIACEIGRIAIEKDKLKQELAALEEYKKSLIKIDDVLFAVYTLPNGELIANAFVYFADTTYKDSDDGNYYRGKHYKSISGNRIIGLDFKQESYLVYTRIESDAKYVINTKPNLWFNFEDVCIRLGKLEMLSKKAISVEEISEVLQLFIDNYDFVKDGDKVEALPKTKIKRS